MTELLEDRFAEKMTSHRAGRWAFDAATRVFCVEHGYRVDCSVTPHVSWAEHPGDPDGPGGTDYTSFPAQPYFLDLDRIDQRGELRRCSRFRFRSSRLNGGATGLAAARRRQSRFDARDPSTGARGAMALRPVHAAFVRADAGREPHVPDRGQHREPVRGSRVRVHGSGGALPRGDAERVLRRNASLALGAEAGSLPGPDISLQEPAVRADPGAKQVCAVALEPVAVAVRERAPVDHSHASGSPPRGASDWLVADGAPRAVWRDEEERPPPAEDPKRLLDLPRRDPEVRAERDDNRRGSVCRRRRCRSTYRPPRGLRPHFASTSNPLRASRRAASIITESPIASGATPGGAPRAAIRAWPQVALAEGTATANTIEMNTARRIER